MTCHCLSLNGKNMKSDSGGWHFLRKGPRWWWGREGGGGGVPCILPAACEGVLVGVACACHNGVPWVVVRQHVHTPHLARAQRQHRLGRIGKGDLVLYLATFVALPNPVLCTATIRAGAGLKKKEP